MNNNWLNQITNIKIKSDIYYRLDTIYKEINHNNTNFTALYNTKIIDGEKYVTYSIAKIIELLFNSSSVNSKNICCQVNVYITEARRLRDNIDLRPENHIEFLHLKNKPTEEIALELCKANLLGNI